MTGHQNDAKRSRAPRGDGWTSDLKGLGSGASRDIKQILAEAEKEGRWEGRRLKSDHLRLRHATGGFASMAITPSDWRTIQNIRRDMRAAARTERRH